MDKKPDITIGNAKDFARILEQERKRTDRSGHPFLLMLITFLTSPGHGRHRRQARTKNVLQSLQYCVRQTDVIGWYEKDAVLGVIYTEISQEPIPIARMLEERVRSALQSHMKPEQIDTIAISTIVYPPDKHITVGAEDSNTDKLYPEYKRVDPSYMMKRLMDVAGSAVLLVLSAPLLIGIGIVIKLTSQGPVLFKQRRIGQFGKPFTLLKFRSMYTEADPQVHRQYVQQLILHRRNGTGEAAELQHAGFYKLNQDERITPIGRVLRSKSLDELPQFLNVLAGTMSLVGPRPPLPYEVECYDSWHMRRVLQAKPGITGLWQIEGRSRTTFDEMVRLDLQYIDQRSILTDLYLLLRTPWVVIKGDGAL